MSSDSGHDLGDYITEDSPHEDGTLFLPTPEAYLDPWTLFFCGILTGLAGGALVTVAPWLAGSLIAAGYFMTALSLKGSQNRFANALFFGFVASAILGAALVVVDSGAPSTTWRLIEAAGNRHLIFPSFTLMPWVLGVLKYVHILIRRRPERAPRVAMVPSASRA